MSPEAKQLFNLCFWSCFVFIFIGLMAYLIKLCKDECMKRRMERMKEKEEEKIRRFRESTTPTTIHVFNPLDEHRFDFSGQTVKNVLLECLFPLT